MKKPTLWERYLTKEIGIEFKACLYFFALLFFLVEIFFAIVLPPFQIIYTLS